jgi:glycosyltransferase involved in cell wall biosynthesis
MKGYYVVDLSFPLLDNSTNGVSRKIFDQLKILRINGIKIELVNLYNSGLIFNLLKRISCKVLVKNVPEDFYFADFYYFRYWRSSFALIKLFSKIKKINKMAKILLEMPTYPYENEAKTLLSKLNILIDKLLRGKLEKYVNRIVTFSKDDEIFSVPTIKIKNGIDCSVIPIHREKKYQNEIHIIALAQFTWWHGYDRLIKGVNEYYKNEINCNVYLHLVGDGTELAEYNRLIIQNNLSKYIRFYGVLSGDKLSEVFNESDIAVCSLGAHRKGLYLSSELKSREYLARGFPMVSSAKIDVLPDNYQYCLYVPEDEEPINIQKIVAYYQELLRCQDVKEIIHNIRRFAEDNCDISKTIAPVIEYLNIC